MREKQSKATQERHTRMLNELLKLPGNDRCADCKAKNPRWASWSLGLFLCIRCASLHRKMGTHISKVKSVSMDNWSIEEIQNMKNLGGNDVRNREINNNPQKYGLPVSLDDDIVMEKYIRDKWERKLFIKDGVKQLSISSTVSSTSSLEELATPTSINGSPKPMILSNSTLPSFAGQMNTSFSESNPFVNKNPFNPFNNNNVTQTFPPMSNMATNPFSNPPRSNSHNPFV